QKIKFSLFLLLVGVGIASITDLQLNFVGAILSLLAVITTCVGQIVRRRHVKLEFKEYGKHWIFRPPNKHNTKEAQCIFYTVVVSQCLTKQNVFAHKIFPYCLGVSIVKIGPI
ncbi:hypothetical protein HYC85_009324, partial [Camellia sinensis]